ncbi:hypothetical protein HYH03_006512 [Edaphochlamys debaryana]|uniref:Protein-S-isoprenylcysteine O-methyltransferase n=1 Tax=Edaphochlamys debaryana TaxID=47281 RepID=A0A835Y501_9CHLO|nr:hypothetical protein HYH03_006512 [Edaphochlamys debaryana]|eukprot:KAG2495239.1 hypothetical protein HYH03_006512 [Edaphochlamys debaryana]
MQVASLAQRHAAPLRWSRRTQPCVGRRTLLIPLLVARPATATNPTDEAAASGNEEEVARAATLIDTAAPAASDAVEGTGADGAVRAKAGDAGEEVEEAPTALSHPLEDVPEELEDDFIGSKELVSELTDPSALGKRGEGILLVQVVAIGMLLFPPIALKGIVDFAAIMALVGGAVFLLSALFALGRAFNPLPQPRKRHHLVVSGIYGYARHPMYAGLLLCALGITILTRNETRLALTLFLWWILEKKLSMEEQALTDRYAAYAEYKEKVKKFIPFVY